jgi:uncharacterized membrane protein
MNTTQSVRDNKRARFTQPNKQNKTVVLVAIVGGVALLLLAAAALLWPRGGAGPVAGAPPAEELPPAAESPQAGLTPASDEVRLPLSTFDDGQAHLYTYSVGNTDVQFFVLKSSDGVVRAAFNACDVCYPAHLGYHQEGDEMVCNNCGRRFPSNLINEVSGGCNPAPLDRTIEGDELVIPLQNVVAGVGYFQ